MEVIKLIMQYILTKEEYNNLVPKEKYYAEMDKVAELNKKVLELSIIYNGRKYKLAIVATEDIVRLTYRCGQPIYNAMLMDPEDMTDRPLSVRIEYVIDRALKAIENKEWEK